MRSKFKFFLKNYYYGSRFGIFYNYLKGRANIIKLKS